MFPTKIQFHDQSPYLSEQKNSHIMDDFINDLEEGIPQLQSSRPLNKKMKKRKQLNALLKFRSRTSKSKETLRSSEDELFLPNQKNLQTSKPLLSSYRRWCNYTRHLLSFCLVCIFMIVCVGLAYANIELKTEVQNLSLRVNEIEKRFSNSDINRILTTLEQIKTRLNLIERWNSSYIYDRLQKLQTDFNHIKKTSPIDETSMIDEDVDISSKLNNIEQKSTQFSEVANELDKLSQDADNQAKDLIHEKTKPYDKNLIEQLLEEERKINIHQDSNQLANNILSLNESLYTNIAKWNDEIKALRNEFQNFNQSTKIQELVLHFQELTNLVHNSSDKTSTVLTALQTNIDKLRSQIEACKCSKDPVYLKPSIVDTDQLQQSIITKPNTLDTSSSSSALFDKINSNNTNDIAQVVNQSSSVSN